MVTPAPCGVESARRPRISRVAYACACIALVTACGGASESAPAPAASDDDGGASALRCAIREGTFTFGAKAISGDCGDLPDLVLDVAATGEAPAIMVPFVVAEHTAPGTVADVSTIFDACKGSVKLDADNCGFDFNVTCPSPSVAGRTLLQSGRATWNEAGTSGAADGVTFSAQAENGAAICKGTYRYSYAK